MSKCPVCGSLNAYKGFKEVECGTPSCRLYAREVIDETLFYVHWKVNGRTGRSKLLPLEEAEQQVKEGLAYYGKGTHWIEKEKRL